MRLVQNGKCDLRKKERGERKKRCDKQERRIDAYARFLFLLVFATDQMNGTSSDESVDTCQ